MGNEIFTQAQESKLERISNSHIIRKLSINSERLWCRNYIKNGHFTPKCFLMMRGEETEQRTSIFDGNPDVLFSCSFCPRIIPHDGEREADMYNFSLYSELNERVESIFEPLVWNSLLDNHSSSKKMIVTGMKQLAEYTNKKGLNGLLEATGNVTIFFNSQIIISNLPGYSSMLFCRADKNQYELTKVFEFSKTHPEDLVEPHFSTSEWFDNRCINWEGAADVINLNEGEDYMFIVINPFLNNYLGLEVIRKLIEESKGDCDYIIKQLQEIIHIPDPAIYNHDRGYRLFINLTIFFLKVL